MFDDDFYHQPTRQLNRLHQTSRSSFQIETLCFLFVFLSHKSVRLAGFSIHTFWQTGFLNTGESRHLFAYFPSIQTQFRIRFEPEALGWHDHCTMTEFLRNIYRQLFLYYSKISRVTPPQLNGFIVYHKTRVQKLVPI